MCALLANVPGSRAMQVEVHRHRTSEHGARLLHVTLQERINEHHTVTVTTQGSQRCTQMERHGHHITSEQDVHPLFIKLQDRISKYNGTKAAGA